MIMDKVFASANRLAKIMIQYKWYHRTSIVDQRIDGKLITYLVVWGEGRRHEEVPYEFDGFPVQYNAVSKRNPCPFGSVKSE